MTDEQALKNLDQAADLLRQVAHSHQFGPGGATPKTNDNIQVAISLVRSAWILVNEGDDAKVPTPEETIRYYQGMKNLSARIAAKEAA